MIQDWLHIDWDQFHFLRPEFLYLLIGVPVIFVVGLFSFRDEEKWTKSIAKHLRPYVIQKGSVRFRRTMHVIMTMVISIACLGIAGPTWSEEELPGQILETPVVIALDMSQSMMATDIQPNRLERAKFKITDLLNANPRARVSLIGFAGTAHTIVPLCQDYNIIKSHLNSLSPSLLPFPGTDFEAALNLADSITKTTNAPSQLVLITDDINEDLFNLLQNYSTREGKYVELIPMNTVSGAEVPKHRGRGAMKDESGEVVYSKLDNKTLSKITSLENVHVNRLTLDNSDVEHIAELISGKLKFQKQADIQENNWQDRGWLLIIPMAFFILIWFRKGFVVYGLLMIFSLNSCTDESSFKDWWYTKDYQGQLLEKEGRYQEAGGTYDDPLRSGVAYYKAGKYDEAISAFSKDTTANGAYNLGLAYYKNGDLAAAQMAFGEAYEMNPKMKDAAKNQETLGELIDAQDELNPEEAQEEESSKQAKNIENKDQEDLGGGGQEATKKDMEKQRKEETVTTDVRKAKELEEVPEDFESGKSDPSQKVLMRKVDDDPSLFLKRKFKREVKVKNLSPKKDSKKW